MPDIRQSSAAPVSPTTSAARVSTPHRAGLLLILVLGSLTALAPLSMDLYLPALPRIAENLSTGEGTVQLTLTACLLGLAAGQLVAGPLSDALGRRRPLLVGLAVYVAATAACAAAPDARLFIAFRLVQGLSGAAGIVIARAVVRDLFDGLAAARFFASLMLVSGTAPILAPMLGGQILRVTSWRGVFVVLAVLGLAILAASALLLRETLPPERRHRGGLSETLRTMRGLLRDRPFTGYVLSGAFAFASLFAYVSGSSFAIQQVYGASPQTYSLLFGVNSVGLVAFGQLNGKVLLGRFRAHRVLLLGLGLMAASSAALVLLVTLTDAGLPWIAAALFVLASSLGLVMPTTTALSLQRAPHAAGTASALLGTVQFAAGALSPALAGLGSGGTALPMAAAMLAMALLAAVVFLAFCRPWRPTADPLATG
ncbi:multidrug effflux MFS transporter [Peterkaempfera bronchialis]|uniref:MFS transporter n=1 Tax=Peterkaempfera bronchialis TaxID=2126346 RepID=A0A345SVD5_9ACTN|nr:multidrug effflux MFS transporter [Peterkaempfera bronchialis]AXI77690.1 MFS transporter [Peterkaempfera bronchialis]